MDTTIPTYLLYIIAGLHILSVGYLIYYATTSAIAGVYFGRPLPKKLHPNQHNEFMQEDLIKMNNILRRDTRFIFFAGISFYVAMNISMALNYVGLQPLQWGELPVHLAIIGQLFLFQEASSFNIVTNIRLRIYMSFLFLYPLGAGLQIGTGDYGHLATTAIWFVLSFKFFFMMIRQHSEAVFENSKEKFRKEAAEKFKKYSPESNN
jgi:hypothetical protein